MTAIDAPHSTRSCVQAAPSLEANAVRTRRLSHSASLRTMRASPRNAASAANSSSSLSSSETASGSSS